MYDKCLNLNQDYVKEYCQNVVFNLLIQIFSCNIFVFQNIGYFLDTYIVIAYLNVVLLKHYEQTATRCYH